MSYEERQRRDIRLTPDATWAALNQLWPQGFFDPCPYPAPTTWNGLTEKWRAPVYVNPPGTLKREFAEKFAEVRGPKCFAVFDWDHSTQYWKTIAECTDVWLLFARRWKCHGPDAKTEEWRAHDVGRCQALMFANTPWKDVEEHFGHLGRLVFAR